MFLAGLIGGFIAGLVGIGGGVVYVFIIPISLSYIGVPKAEIVQYTIANSMFAILFASASANYVLIRLKLFYRKAVLIISLSAIVSSVLVLHFIVNTPWYSLRVFNIIIVVLLFYMLFTTLRSARKVFVFPLDSLKRWKLAIVGAAGGTIAALSGLGGGIVIIPILNSFMKIDMRKASSISSGVIMLTALTMTLYNLFEKPVHEFKAYNMGYIIFPIALTLSLGVVIASPFGVKISRKLSSSTISYIYAGFLILVILKKVAELFHW
ncbi:MAG: sulfite exporter TauE/SafE family protein [Cytophagaceae bacterium]